MNDDELMAKVKGALECQGGVSAACLASVRAEAARMSARRRCRSWWRRGAGLLAASLAIVLVWQFHVCERDSAESDLISTIKLLSVVDGRQVDGEGAAELLLAWQDAPYVEICGTSVD